MLRSPLSRPLLGRLLFGLLTLTIALPALAQGESRTSANPAASAPEVVIKPGMDEKLRGVIDSIERRKSELAELRKQRSKEPSPELDKRIDQTNQQIDELRTQFVGLATRNYNLSEPGTAPELAINWQDELIQVIYPLLREINDLTEKPRQIEKLKMEITLYEGQALTLTEAEANLETALADSTDKTVRRSLQALQADLAERTIENEQKLESLQHQLEELQADIEPLWTSMVNGAKSFLTNVGFHFGLALGMGIGVYYLIQLIGRLALRTARGKEEKRLASVERLIIFVIKALGGLVGLFIYLMVLYALDSWVILGLTVIVLIALVFSLKNTIPDYLVEMRTLLNFGSIRQGERVDFNGLPWRIHELDVYTTLHNPALDGLVRVPLTQLSRSSSRPYHSNEPWFPSQTGDWVLLSDSIYGQVKVQTPDLVQLNVGDSTVNYRTPNFLNARPQNMSGGFTVASTFGLDYRHQSDAATTIPETMRSHLEEAMKAEDFGEHCTYLNVELGAANASSLDFRLIATFKGVAADRYFRIQRWLQRSAVACANRQGWSIPFPQVVVHSAPTQNERPPTAPAAPGDDG